MIRLSTLQAVFRHLARALCLAFLLGACAPGTASAPAPPATATRPPAAAASATQPTATPIPAAPTLPPTPPAPAVRRLNLGLLQNAAFHSPDWGDYQLAEGIFYRPPAAPGESAQLYISQLFMSAFGDLNGDGYEDAAVILQTKNGGNGDNKELAVLLDQDGKAVNTATLYVGANVAVESVEIEAEVITLKMRIHGPNDGLCCPSQPETRQYRLENGQLKRTGAK